MLNISVVLKASSYIGTHVKIRKKTAAENYLCSTKKKTPTLSATGTSLAYMQLCIITQLLFSHRINALMPFVIKLDEKYISRLNIEAEVSHILHIKVKEWL